MITPLLEEYRKLWPLNYMRYEQQAFKLTEEAHFLSTLYYRLGCTNNIADEYIKRMWTALQCDNVEKKDGNLPIWHLPAEKKYGFEKLFAWFADNENITREDYLRMSDRVIGVSGSRSMRALRRGKDKILKKKN